MSKGILIYALNNEQIDYVKLAVFAAKKIKEHLDFPIALVTDSSDWLYKKYPDWRQYFEFVIKIVSSSDIEKWNSDRQYPVGSSVYYNGTIWKKIREGQEYVSVINEEVVDEYSTYTLDDLERVYKGIDIDKWYPNLPYLKGQHVWYENTLYRCHTDYQEQEEFSKDKYDILVENVKDLESAKKFMIGDIFLHDRVLWQSKIDYSSDEIVKRSFDRSTLERIYEGIDIDKWHPSLPYLKGQHVWYENTLYRCEIGYTEEETFSEEKYIVLIENVKDLESAKKFKIGDIFLHDRVLWQSTIDYETEIVKKSFNLSSLERIYEGIDIDKWYPSLPYLKGQHVWYDNTLYRCQSDYQEQEEFSKDKYEILVENVKELEKTVKFLKGDTLLYDRVLWMANDNYDSTLSREKIRTDIWEDTRERFLVYDPKAQYRRYFDGSLAHKRLRFKNDIRIKSFELSPFNETLVIDSDYIINNDTLKHCWEQPHDFLIFKDAMDLSGYRHDPRLYTLSDKSIDFYWATVFFFRKNKNTETFFNYLGHIQENWNYYRHIYQIEHALYRNDYAFSIALHVMNGFQKGSWAHNLPGKLYYTIDKDLLTEINGNEMKFLLEKEKFKGEYTIMKTKNINVHIMNKFSLGRLLDEAHDVENSF